MRVATRKALIVVLLLGVVTLLVLIAMMRDPNPQMITLKDGRTVRLLGISHGQPHTLSQGLKAKVVRLLPPNLKHLAGPNFNSSFGFGSPGMALWLTSCDPGAGGYQSGWINHCIIIDEHGCEYPAQGLGSTSDGRYDARVVFFSAYPRRAPSFVCRIYDNNQQPVGDLRIENLTVTNAPEWSPEPFPVWKTNGSLVLRLDGFKSRTEPKFEVSRNGTVEDFWAVEDNRFEDSSGNSGHLLCRRESAWRWKGTLHRTVVAPFLDSELSTLTNIAVPAQGSFVALTNKLRINGEWITNIVITGPGRYDLSNGVLTASVPWRNGMGGGHGSSSSGSGAGQIRNIWRSSERVCLWLPVISLPENRRLIVRIRENNTIFSEAWNNGAANSTAFYEMRTSISSPNIDIDFIVDPGYTFEAKFDPKIVPGGK